MERSRVTLMTLMCVLFSRISGAEVQLRVRRGDDVMLYCDRTWMTGVNKVWFRNSSNNHQPPLMITEEHLKSGTFPRYSFLWNPSIRTHDLLVKNVTESDLGLYYCGGHEKSAFKQKAGAHVVLQDVYYYGYRITRLSLFDTTVPSTDPPQTSDCSVYWKLLVSVCPVCVLLSSTCLYCISRNTTKGSKQRKEQLTGNVFQVGCAEDHQCERSMNGESCLHTEVYYTSLKSAPKSN